VQHGPPVVVYVPVKYRRKLGKISRTLLLTVSFITFLLGVYNLIGFYIWNERVAEYDETLHGTAVFGALCLPVGIILVIISILCLFRYYRDSKSYPPASKHQIKTELFFFGLILLIFFAPIFIFISFIQWGYILYGSELFKGDDLDYYSSILYLLIFSIPVFVGSISVGFKIRRRWNKLVPIILIISLILLPTVYCYNGNIIEEVSEKTEIEYNFETRITGYGNYTLYLPLPTDNNGQMLPEVIEKFEYLYTQGFSLEIINTEYGKGLKVVGSNDIDFETEIMHMYKSSDLSHYIQEERTPHFRSGLTFQVNGSRRSSLINKTIIYCSKDNSISKIGLSLSFLLDYEFSVHNDLGIQRGSHGYVNRLFDDDLDIIEDGWFLIEEKTFIK
jgi:hypothetical protein